MNRQAELPFLAAPINSAFYEAPENKYYPETRRELSFKFTDVFHRLTNPAHFTGCHRERFDEFGNGRGLAGREYVYIYDGLTESPSRTHEVYSSVIRRPKKPIVQPGTIGMQRFGVQNVTPRLMWLYRNGDKHHEGVPFFVRKHIATMEALYQEATKVVVPICGPIRKLYDQNLRQVCHLEDIVDGGKYLCCSGEPPTTADRLERFISNWVLQR